MQFEMASSGEMKGNYEILLERARTEIAYQKVFYNDCVKILYPVYARYVRIGQKYGCNEADIFSCIADAIYIIFKNENMHFENFESYLRKRYEYCILNLILKNRNYYKGQVPFERLEDQEEISAKNKNISFDPTRKALSDAEVLKFVDNNREKFDYNEVAIINFYHLGYNINEISQKLHFSYNKTKRMFDNMIFKLRNILVTEEY